MMSRHTLAFGALITASIAVAPARAQDDPYPRAGQIYLSFHPEVQVSTRDVTPGEEFQLWISVDIPIDPQAPQQGIVGVEGGVALPPSLEFVEIAFGSSAVNVGPSFREPGLESFIVGLGECLSLGPRHALGVMTLRLAEAGSDIEISVTAPSVGAAAVSSFAGIGPGWADRDCPEGGEVGLILFEAPVGPGHTLIVNSTAVPTDRTGFSALKARYGN